MYIYINEDWQFGIALTAPKAQDLEQIADGTLTVLRCEPNPANDGVIVREVLEDGTLGECTRAQLQDDENGEYHIIHSHD